MTLGSTPISLPMLEEYQFSELGGFVCLTLQVPVFDDGFC
jgi:hypothetical protein